MANVACRYILEEPAVGGIIIGARLGQAEHIQNNLRLFQFSLDESSRSKIRDVLARLKPIPGECGDEYRKPPFLTASGDLSHHAESFPLPYESQDTADGQLVILSGDSHAVRRDDHIHISATDATYGNRIIGDQDVVAQFHFVVDKIEGALNSLGGRLNDVVCTDVRIREATNTGVVARAYMERFCGIQHANTITQAKIKKEGCLVEIQADVIVSGESK